MVYDLGVPEPESDLLLSVLDGVRPVADVPPHLSSCTWGLGKKVNRGKCDEEKRKLRRKNISEGEGRANNFEKKKTRGTYVAHARSMCHVASKASES